MAHLTLSTKKLKKYFSFIHASPTSSTQSSPFPLDEKISLVAPRPPAPPQKSQNVTVITLSSLSRQTSRDPSSSLSTASNNGLSFFRRRPSARKSAPKAGAPGGPRTSTSVSRTSGSRPGSANARSRPGSGTVVVVASGSGAAPSAFKGVKGSSRRHTFGQEEVVEKKKPRPLPPRGAIVPTQIQGTVEDDVEPTLPKVDKGKQRDFDPSPSPSPSPSLSSTSSPRRHHQRNLSFPLDSYSPVHTEPPVTRFGFKNLILHSDGRGYDDHDEQDPPSPVPPPHVSIPAAHDTPQTKTRELDPPVIAQQQPTKSRPLPKVPPPSPPAGHPPSSPSPTSYSSSSSSSANTKSAAAAVPSKPIAVPSQPSPRDAVPAPPSPPHAAPPILPSSSAALLSPTIPSSSSPVVTSLSASSPLPTSAHTPVPADADADGEKRRERGEGRRLLISSAPMGRLRGKRNQPLPRTPVSPPPPLTTTTMVQSPTQMHGQLKGEVEQTQMEGGGREGVRVQLPPSPPPRLRKESGKEVIATQASGASLTPVQSQPSSSPSPPPPASHNQAEVQSTPAPHTQTHRTRTSSATTKTAQQTQAGTATQRLLQQQVQRQKQREQLQTLFRQESESSALGSGSLARAGTSSSKTSAATIANSKSTTMAAMETGALSEQVTRKVQIGEPRRLRKGSLPAAAPGGPQPPRPPPKIFRSTSVANSVSSYALTPATKANVNLVPPPASVVSSISNMSNSTSTSSNSNSTSTPSSNSTSTAGRGSTSTPTPTHPNSSASTSSKGKPARMTVTPVSPAPRSPGRYIPPPPRPPPRHQPLPPTPITSSTSTSSPPSSSTHVQSPPPPAAPKTPPTSSNTPQVQPQVSVSVSPARPPPTAFARSASTGVVSGPTTRVVSVQPPPSARPPPPPSLQRAMSSAVVGTRGPRGAVGARGVVAHASGSEGGIGVAMTVGPRTRTPSVPVPSPSLGGAVKALPAVPLAPVHLPQSIPLPRATPQPQPQPQLHTQQVKQPPRVPTELALQDGEGVEVGAVVRDGASGSWSAKVREMSERLGDVSHHVEVATGGVSETGRGGGGGGGAAVPVQGKRRPLPVPPTPSSR